MIRALGCLGGLFTGALGLVAAFMALLLLAGGGVGSNSGPSHISFAVHPTSSGHVSAPPHSWWSYFHQAAMRFHVPIALLEAIAFVESDYGTNDGPSSAGAIGPMQFEPATWQIVSQNLGYSTADIWHPQPAIMGAAWLLAQDGATTSTGLSAAIFAYNHSAAYVNQVLGTMHILQRLATQGGAL